MLFASAAFCSREALRKGRHSRPKEALCAISACSRLWQQLWQKQDRLLAAWLCSPSPLLARRKVVGKLHSCFFRVKRRTRGVAPGICSCSTQLRCEAHWALLPLMVSGIHARAYLAASAFNIPVCLLLPLTGAVRWLMERLCPTPDVQIVLLEPQPSLESDNDLEPAVACYFTDASVRDCDWEWNRPGSYG